MPDRKVLAIVPARGGSKGVPRKNIKPLAGEPLIVHAIRAARGAESITHVIVTTEDDEIAAVAKGAGAEVSMRPKELATDEAPMMPVLNHVLDYMAADGREFDAVVLIDVTSPLLRSDHIDMCVEKLVSGSTQSAVTVTQLERNPDNIFVVDGDDAVRFIESPNASFKSRHEFSHLKRINGCVYATWVRNIRAGKLIVDPVKVVEMRPEESINIDTPLDFAVAEFCYEGLSGHGSSQGRLPASPPPIVDKD